MRSRSGGIHSNSEEEYIQLADVAQQCKSLFYDELKPSLANKRRKYAFSQNSSKPIVQSKTIKQQQQVKSNKTFENFNFDQQSYNFEKDCQQLKKIEENMKSKTQKLHYTILSQSSVHEITKILQKILGTYIQVPQGPSRAINLLTHHSYNLEQDRLFIDCYWIIDMSQAQTYGSLFNVYIQKSSQVLNLAVCKETLMQQQNSQSDDFSTIRSLIQRINYKRFKQKTKQI